MLWQILKQTEKYFKYIKSELKKYKKYSKFQFESTKESFIQGILARGDRKISQVIYEAHLNGGSKAILKRALKTFQNQCWMIILYRNF